VSRRIQVLALALGALLASGPVCGGAPKVRWITPRPGDVVSDFSFQAVFQVDAPAVDTSGLQIWLNDELMEAVEGPPGVFTVSIDPGPPLRDHNVLRARIPLAGPGNAARVRVAPFRYLPPGKARAFEITDPDDLLEGPLAHNQLGDFMLANDVARFVVQKAGVRDLHSVGQYGGNLIDAELVARPGQDNFFELQPSTNIETVIHATSVTVLNDGQDGTAAIVESCGPDDLLDYINASSQVGEFGAALPAGVDDQDHEVEGCTRFELPPRLPGEAGNRLEMTTTVFNIGSTPVGLFPGDYLNGMGELEQYTRLAPETQAFASAGIGELLAIPSVTSFSYFGFGRAAGVSYGRVGRPVPGRESIPDSSFSTSGVSFVVTAANVVELLIPPADLPTLTIPGGGDASFGRVFVVGDGDVADVTAAEADVAGQTTGTVSGCVTVGGAPAPGARVSAGFASGGTLDNLIAAWVTDAAGCYEGRMAADTYAIAAARDGAPYEGGGALPALSTLVVPAGGVVVQDFALPATGRLRVEVVDPAGDPIPARVTVVGFDPSPEPVIRFDNPFFGSDGGTFKDITKDPLPFGIAAVRYTGADGSVAFDVEPGSYEVVVSRGTEYSIHREPVTMTAGATTDVSATIARVLDTTGFVSSDFHVHSINSPDSRISIQNRSVQFAGEGVENYIATDHDARTDPDAIIASVGLTARLAGTVGEEITTFDTGHYNAYPLGVDPARPSGGSTDWARAAPAGEDFPSQGAFIRTPAEIQQEVFDQEASDGSPLNTSADLVVQINHIGSHFGPLKIDTSQEPPRSFLSSAEAAAFRLDPAVTDFFHPFPALELWNGATRAAQEEFRFERIGIWMNHLNQGLRPTFIADTDTHTFLNLRTAGARTWTASPTDDPSAIDSDDVGAAVLAGRAVGGQGIYVQTRLRETDAPANEAHLGLGGSTTLVTAGDGNVTLVIDVQAPMWAQFDQVAIFTNARTFASGTNDGVPVDFLAIPDRVLTRGTDFVLPPPVEVVPGVPGAERQELHLEETFALTEDTWFVVLVRGSDGISEPMFPVYPSSLATGSNPTLADLLDGNLGESGTMALGATNALYADVDGIPGFDPPGVRLFEF